MINPYLKNLNKIEFVVTDACTGRCKHCSQGERGACATRIDPSIAAEAVRKIAAVYPVQTVMTFGGGPLLHPEAVYAVMSVAKEWNIPRRQVITNGCFSKNEKQIQEIARQLSVCGVNDLLLSVDAFHQETLSLDVVKYFAAEAQKCGVPMRLSPAWLVSVTDDNPYNRRTREIVQSFDGMQIPTGEGNVIFPEGNALRYLGEYFTDVCPENPYEEDPRDMRCISFSANGDVLGGNVYREDILKIMESYAP